MKVESLEFQNFDTSPQDFKKYFETPDGIYLSKVTFKIIWPSHLFVHLSLKCDSGKNPIGLLKAIFISCALISR